MLAGVEAPARNLGVHPEGWRHDDGFEIFLLEHLTPFGVVARRRRFSLRDDLVSLCQRAGIDVAERAHVSVRGIRIGQQHAALCADADEADLNRTAADGSFHRGGGAERGQGRRAGEHLQKIPATKRFLFGREVHTVSIGSIERDPKRVALHSPSRD